MLACRRKAPSGSRKSFPLLLPIMAIYPIILAFILSSTFNAVQGLKCQQGGDRPFHMFMNVECPRQHDKCAEMIVDVFEEEAGRNSTEQFGNANATSLFTMVVKACAPTCDELVKGFGEQRSRAKDEPRYNVTNCTLCGSDLCNGAKGGGLKCQEGLERAGHRYLTNVECAQQQDQCAEMTLEPADPISEELVGNANATASNSVVAKGCARTCDEFFEAFSRGAPNGKGFGKDGPHAKVTSCTLCKGDLCNGGVKPLVGNGAAKLAAFGIPLGMLALCFMMMAQHRMVL